MAEQIPRHAHAVCCIKYAMFDILQDACAGDSLTVACDRSDCWDCAELWRYRAALNLTTGDERVSRESTKITTKSGKQVCAYKATLDVFVEAYVEACEHSVCMAYGIASKAVAAIYDGFERVPAQRMFYDGSSRNINEMLLSSVSSVVVALSVEYYFIPERPGTTFCRANHAN